MGVSRDCPNFLSTPIISGSLKATNFKFDRCIHWVHANKCPLKCWRKGSVGVSRDWRNFFSTPYILSQERVKLRTCNFVRTFLVSIGTKTHYKFREKYPWASQDSRNFSGHRYIGRIVRLLLRTNRKSHMRFRLAPISVTLNDLRNAPLAK